jgi:hypothetical protein
MKSARRIIVWIFGLAALGCGPALPPPSTTKDPIAAKAAPAAADPDEEAIYPDGATGTPAGPDAEAASEAASPAPTQDQMIGEIDPELTKTLDAAEKDASPEGRLVLATGRKMALVDREVILGACWDYANTVYKRAGFPSNGRKTIFNRPKTGPYADPGLFRPGDFLSYSHDEKGEWVHSAIFVGWTDAGEHVALMLSYPGGKRPVPASYSRYELTRVFRVVRPKP